MKLRLATKSFGQDADAALLRRPLSACMGRIGFHRPDFRFDSP